MTSSSGDLLLGCPPLILTEGYPPLVCRRCLFSSPCCEYFVENGRFPTRPPKCTGVVGRSNLVVGPLCVSGWIVRNLSSGPTRVRFRFPEETSSTAEGLFRQRLHQVFCTELIRSRVPSYETFQKKLFTTLLLLFPRL